MGSGIRKWADEESDTDRRVHEHRTAEATLLLRDPAGRPLGQAGCQLELVRHEFRLGANAFLLGAAGEPRLQDAYDERFAALLNFATLPFYWAGYEPVPGECAGGRLSSMAEWCGRHGIAAKGHPLVWHEAFPAWAAALSDRQVLARLRRRVLTTVQRFRGLVEAWDVVNEATVSHRFDNTVGRWMARRGPAACVGQALGWAHAADPRATLVCNDFNVSDEYEALAAALLSARAPVHALGIQSHMHKGTWPLDRAWEVCAVYGRFGLPLHFTELTVLSGAPKAADDNDWHAVRPDWPSTAGGEAAQLAYASALYTLLFSHPAVEAITWWDFSDRRSWQGAPSGLLRRDMSPKPLYEWLADTFGRRWRTSVAAAADGDGRLAFRGFFGDYEVRVAAPWGDLLWGTFHLGRRGVRRLEVALSPRPAPGCLRP